MSGTGLTKEERDHLQVVSNLLTDLEDEKLKYGYPCASLEEVVQKLYKLLSEWNPKHPVMHAARYSAYVIYRNYAERHPGTPYIGMLIGGTPALVPSVEVILGRLEPAVADMSRYGRAGAGMMANSVRTLLTELDEAAVLPHASGQPGE